MDGFAEALQGELGEKEASKSAGEAAPETSQGPSSSEEQEKKEDNGGSKKEEAAKDQPPDAN